MTKVSLWNCPPISHHLDQCWPRCLVPWASLGHSELTHWGRVMHICVSKLSILGSDNGLSPGRRQAIIWTNAGKLLIGPLGTNFSEILIKILTFSFKKMRLKVSSAKGRPFCLGLNVLTHGGRDLHGWMPLRRRILNSIFLNENVWIILQPLLHICNLSFTHGVFPDGMKLAKVIPLFKSGNSMKVNNFRPVSILPVLSKILERLMYNRLLKFIEEFNILYDFQFGFRKFHSTFMALASAVNHIVNALQFGKYSIGVYLEFSKAFDTLDHDILFFKLNHYGIRGIALDWIKSYMLNRKQFVSYNDNSSDIQSISCGVPQGSILGPLLFLIYVNDLPNVSDMLFTVMFADDTSMFVNVENLSTLETQLNSELKHVSTWLQVNKLSLNVDKSCFIVFKTVKKSDLKVNICINDKRLSRVSQVKFLGTIIDDKLTWKPHIDYISKKLSKAIAIMYRLKAYVTQETLCSLYYSLVYPYLTYCNVVWGNTFKTHLKPLISLQRKAVGCLNFRNHNEFGTDALMLELKLIKFCDLNKYLTCQFMHKLNSGNVPNVITNYFTINNSVHDYNMRLSKGFHVPKIGNDYGKRTLQYNGCLLWNKIILLNVNFDCSLASFKYKIRYNLSSL